MILKIKALSPKIGDTIHAPHFATAVSAGIALHFWDMDFSGGVEVFEPKRQANRKTYFSMTVESKF